MPRAPRHDTVFLKAAMQVEGDIPGDGRLLALDATAFDRRDGAVVGRFAVDVASDERLAMETYRAFLSGLPSRPVFVNADSPMDFIWHHWHLERSGGDPCGFQAFDPASAALAASREAPFGRDAVYVSIDIEADGPIPGPNAMMSIGAAAFDLDRNLIGTFYANLLPLPGSAPDPVTKAEFWDRNPAALAATQVDRRPPGEAMAEYRRFLDGLPGTPVFVGFPASFDHMWHHWYLAHHLGAGNDPCGERVLDLKSYAAEFLGCGFRASAKRNFPREWFAGAPPHDHVAITDAIGQGAMAVNMIRHNLGLPPIGPASPAVGL
jgi:hypothetical protein